MSDLKRDLRRYIDGLEEPVSVQETMERGTRRRRFQVPAAVLAGAAVVLIPALVLIGLRLLPGDDGDVADTTSPPSTVTTVVTDTTTQVVETTTPPPTVTYVVVPDLVGLSEQQARQALLDLGLDLTVAESRAHATLRGVSAQDPQPGAEVAVGSIVTVDVYIQAGCAARVFAVPEGSMAVTLQRLCPPAEYPAHWQALSHIVPAGSDPVATTLQLLVGGPDDWETENGYASMFSASSRNALEAVSLDGERAIVDFNDAILVNNASTSTGSTFFLAELQANLFQFAEINEIEFRIDESCSTFWAGLERECRVLTRADWEAAVATWDDESGADSQDQYLIDRGEIDMIGNLLAFAQGEGPFSGLSFANEVTLGLNTVEQVTVDAADLEAAASWVVPRDDFGGIVGPFDVLGPLRSGPAVVEVNLGPRTHCAGPPLTFGSEWSEGRHLVIEPTEFDSCLQWFAIHVLLNANREIQAVTLDLWEP